MFPMDPVAAANKVEYKTACPRCRERGQDTKGDNLAVYYDGHSHCYGCGLHIASPSIDRLRMEALAKKAPTVKASDDLLFPRDYIPLLDSLNSKEAQLWLRKYRIWDDEIVKHKIGWSSEQSLLIYPVFDRDNNLIMWQGRNFGEGVKYLTKGPKSDILHTVGQSSRGVIIVTEDLVSAIAVGRVYQAAPLWGSEMSLRLIKTVATGFDVLGVWLDPDKTQKAVEIALRASQYIPTFIVTSTKDPKEYNTEAITEFVEIAGRDKLWKDTVEKQTHHADDPCDEEIAMRQSGAFKDDCPLDPSSCQHRACDGCANEEQEVKEARAASALRAVQAGVEQDSNVKINALFSGHIQCEKCKRKVTMIEDCMVTTCPFAENILPKEAYIKPESIKYNDPNVDRPWDYRKAASGS